jgi:hypothetical protein
MTATANATFTAAQFNAHVRDNLNETAPSKATTANRWFVSTGANAIAERGIERATVATAQPKGAGAYGDLTTAGPAVTVTTGTKAIVVVAANISINATINTGRMSYAVSGATTIAAGDSTSLAVQGVAASSLEGRASVMSIPTLTAGSNVFTAKYWSSGSTSTFSDRSIIVMGL